MNVRIHYVKKKEGKKIVLFKLKDNYNGYKWGYFIELSLEIRILIISRVMFWYYIPTEERKKYSFNALIRGTSWYLLPVVTRPRTSPVALYAWLFFC